MAKLSELYTEENLPLIRAYELDKCRKDYSEPYDKDMWDEPPDTVNCTLQQFDKFLDFYGITEGDGMYLAPGDRVLIW